LRDLGTTLAETAGSMSTHFCGGLFSSVARTETARGRTAAEHLVIAGPWLTRSPDAGAIMLVDTVEVSYSRQERTGHAGFGMRGHETPPSKSKGNVRAQEGVWWYCRCLNGMMVGCLRILIHSNSFSWHYDMSSVCTFHKRVHNSCHVSMHGLQALGVRGEPVWRNPCHVLICALAFLLGRVCQWPGKPTQQPRNTPPQHTECCNAAKPKPRRAQTHTQKSKPSNTLHPSCCQHLIFGKTPGVDQSGLHKLLASSPATGAALQLAARSEVACDVLLCVCRSVPAHGRIVGSLDWPWGLILVLLSFSQTKCPGRPVQRFPQLMVSPFSTINATAIITTSFRIHPFALRPTKPRSVSAQPRSPLGPIGYQKS
jgi:hypothetical protein